MQKEAGRSQEETDREREQKQEREYPMDRNRNEKEAEVRACPAFPLPPTTGCNWDLRHLAGRVVGMMGRNTELDPLQRDTVN